jgi:uncharacterized repeat protein (TIGR02543 family)
MSILSRLVKTQKNVSLSAKWKKNEARDDRIFEWDTNYGRVKATIGEIVRADGTFYSVDTTEDPGAIENHRTATWNQYPRTYVVYVSLPSQLSNGRYRVFLPTWGDSGYTPAGYDPGRNQGQDDLIWYGDVDADSLIGFVPTMPNGATWSSAYNSQYRASSTNGWERNGGHFDYAQFIDGYSDTTHSSYTGFTQNFRWDWVYPENGYYDSNISNWHMHTDLYVYDTQTKSQLLGNGHVLNAYVYNPPCFGEMKYQLRGHVFYNNNDGSDAKTDRIMDINMDIIRADIPEQIRSNPTRNGYTFIGWGTSATTDTIYSKWNWRPQKDLNLYAQWMQNAITL